MATLRSTLGSTTWQIATGSGTASLICTASFASSSRIGLDFTLPRRAPTTTTTTTYAPDTVQTHDSSYTSTQTSYDRPRHNADGNRFARESAPHQAPLTGQAGNRGPSSASRFGVVAGGSGGFKFNPSRDTESIYAARRAPVFNLEPQQIPKFVTVPSHSKDPKAPPTVQLRYAPEKTLVDREKQKAREEREERERATLSASGVDTSVSDPSLGLNNDYGYQIGSRSSDVGITHTLHVRSSRNNAHLNFTDDKGPLWSNISGGHDKVFKKSNRSANEAAHQAAQKTFERIHEYISGLPKDAVVIRVAFNGLLGVAREAVVAALMQDKNAPIRSLIRQIVDVTPVKIRGVRARKPRR